MAGHREKPPILVSGLKGPPEHTRRLKRLREGGLRLLTRTATFARVLRVSLFRSTHPFRLLRERHRPLRRVNDTLQLTMRTAHPLVTFQVNASRLRDPSQVPIFHKCHPPKVIHTLLYFIRFLFLFSCVFYLI